MKISIVCETWSSFLPLLQYDKIDTNSSQMIGAAFKRRWPLPRANPLKALASGSWSIMVQPPGTPMRISWIDWPWRTRCFVLTAANCGHARSAWQCWLLAEGLNVNLRKGFTLSCVRPRCSLALPLLWDWMHWIVECCFITPNANPSF